MSRDSLSRLSKRRIASAGWVAGAFLGVGVGMLGWANVYVALLITLCGIGYTATVWIGCRSRRRSGRTRSQTPKAAVPDSHLRQRVQLGWRRERREGEVVLVALGRRIRFYAGHSYFARPLLHRWAAYGSQGVALRFRRGVPGPTPHRVFGVQWRRA